jgi:hypothetical protein
MRAKRVREEVTDCVGTGIGSLRRSNRIVSSQSVLLGEDRVTQGQGWRQVHCGREEFGSTSEGQLVKKELSDRQLEFFQDPKQKRGNLSHVSEW